MAILFPFPSSKARVRAMSSANWAEVPGGRGLASMVSKLETTALEKKKKCPLWILILNSYILCNVRELCNELYH